MTTQILLNSHINPTIPSHVLTVSHNYNALVKKHTLGNQTHSSNLLTVQFLGPCILITWDLQSRIIVDSCEHLLPVTMPGLTSTPKKPFHVAVIGGGIGGLCMTIGLLHQNISCKVYEAASAFAEIGAGVSFGPNAVRAMALIDPAIREGYNRRVTTNFYPEKMKTWFDFRIGQEHWEGKAPGKVGQHIASVLASDDVGQSSVHRAHFLDELIKLVPKEVAEFGKRVKNVKAAGDKMVITFSDGSTAEADAVLGCDGIKSRTKEILLGKEHETAHAVFSGKYAYRGLIPMDKAIKAVGEEYARNSQMYLGQHGHVLTFPIEKGDTMNVVAFRTKKDGKWDDEEWVLPMKKEDMFDDFAAWGDSVKQILFVGLLNPLVITYTDKWTCSSWRSRMFGPCSITLLLLRFTKGICVLLVTLHTGPHRTKALELGKPSRMHLCFQTSWAR